MNFESVYDLQTIFGSTKNQENLTLWLNQYKYSIYNKVLLLFLKNQHRPIQNHVLMTSNQNSVAVYFYFKVKHKYSSFKYKKWNTNQFFQLRQ